MHYFVDSSALAKLFLREHGTEEMTLFVENAPANSLVCSALGVLEVRSAIRRKLLFREVSASHAHQALLSLQDEMSRWIVTPIDASVLAMAATCIDQYAIRTLDAIQLGTALLTHSNDAVTFIAADKRLLEAAQACGLSVLSPEQAGEL